MIHTKTHSFTKLKKVIFAVVFAFLATASFAQNVTSQNTQSVKIGSWKKNDFTTTYTEHSWDFSQYISSVITKPGTYEIVFTYTSGAHKLNLKDATVKADGKTVASIPTEKSAGANPKSITYTFELSSVPRKLTLTANAKTGGGSDSNGKIELKVSAFQNGVLNVPEGTKEIKNSAYINLDIKKVNIPSSVTKIGNDAFKGCVSLTEITIPASVTEFGTGIFNNCDSLKAIKVDKYSDAHAFFSADERLAFTSNRAKKTKEQWLASSKYNILDNGILYVGNGVTKINDGEYKNKDIREIVFSDSVERIGVGAFQGNKELKKVVIPGNVKIIADSAFSGLSLEEVVCEEGVEKIQAYAFYNCPKLNSVTLPKSATTIVPDGLYWQNKDSRVFHCYAGSQAYNLAVQNGYQMIDIVGIDEAHKDTIDLKYVAISGNKTVKAGLFRDLPIERIDINNDITEIGRNAFNDKTTIRVKKGTFGDKWCKANGYYLCGVLADINTYTKDRSKRIEEDFTRILCDDDPYVNWTSYNFKIQEPLKLEEVDDKLVLTSFMLYPCENVTVTTKDGKTLIRNKTIHPLTRTVLCDFNFLTDSVENYTVTSTDEFYKRLVSIPTKWNIKFNGYVIRASEQKDRIDETMSPVYVREWIATIYDMAYVAGIPEFTKRCYEAVENKTLVTNEELTEPLTKEQMDKLLQKTLNYSLSLGRNKEGFGGGGGTTLHLAGSLILGIPASKNYVDAHAFWHEFSHCMGWAHEQGNMCYLGRPAPYDTPWPAIAAKLYVEELEKGTPPYIEGTKFFNANLFSRDKMNFNPDDDVVKNDTLYIAEGMPFIDSHKKQADFTKVVIPDSVEVIKDSAFYDTRLTEVTIPGTVKVIGNAAFRDCSNLTKVVIQDGVRKIDDNAFNGTAITEITIPASVTEIGKNITSKNVIWNVKEGSYAYQFAQER